MVIIVHVKIVRITVITIILTTTTTTTTTTRRRRRRRKREEQAIPSAVVWCAGEARRGEQANPSVADRGQATAFLPGGGLQANTSSAEVPLQHTTADKEVWPGLAPGPERKERARA